MDTGKLDALVAATTCDVRRDDLTRQLYATDASIYQVEPLAVAFPRSAEETRSVILAAGDCRIPVTGRGAGTGLTGGALGSGLVVDLARYSRGISEFDAESKTVRVGPGVVLDQLNAFLQPHGLGFGPDVATSSRATLGGMIGNNSSGAHAPVYGVTSQHLASIDVVLPDGRVAKVSRTLSDDLADLRRAVEAVVERHADAIRERMPGNLVKRWSGYGLDRYLRDGRHLLEIVSGSEGTLGLVVSAVLNLIPLPNEKGLGLLFFSSVSDAMQATVELLDLEPAAIEHIDAPLLDQTKGHPAFSTTRDLLKLDDEPCQAILIVEFFDVVEDRLAELARRSLGLRQMQFTDAAGMETVWNLRKAGLNLLTARKGPAKPIAGLEDVAILPERLPEYVAALRSVMDPLGLEASFYGHAASGLLHVRPIVDLHRAEDIVKYRKLADEVSVIVREFKGSIAAEHGVGMARTQYLADQVGPELIEAMRAIKNAFDPNGLMNPGKVIDDGTYHIDECLRLGAGHSIELPFEPVLAFAARDGSFVGNLEQCNGCGGCRKDPAAMCPTFQVTCEEIMSTRGRANAIRAVLEGRCDSDVHPLESAGLEEALTYCLSCKACKRECPSNVDLSLLKAELLHARQKREGLSLCDLLISDVDVLGRFACLTPRLANAVLGWRWVRVLMERMTGINAERSLPEYALERFDTWFQNRTRPSAPTRGRVFLWDDTFVRYYEPQVGKAAVAVLEAAGYEVLLPTGHKDSGRPSFSVGRLDRAKRLGEHNVRLFRDQGGDEPILFLEPSAFSMFVSDYIELGIEGAGDVAHRCLLFEAFVGDLLEREPDALRFKPAPVAVAVHTHCHAKALTDPSVTARLARRLPDSRVQELDTGCCGMAGAFGTLKAKQAVSLDVAQPLVNLVNGLEPGTRVVACGTSCRHQIRDLTQAKPIHVAELVADALESSPEAAQ